MSLISSIFKDTQHCRKPVHHIKAGIVPACSSCVTKLLKLSRLTSIHVLLNSWQPCHASVCKMLKQHQLLLVLHILFEAWKMLLDYGQFLSAIDAGSEEGNCFSALVSNDMNCQ